MHEYKLSYEEAAEHLTGIEGWVCKTCRKFWTEDEHMARYCCSKDRRCETKDCPNRSLGRGFLYCQACSDLKDHERWLKLREVEWDGETPLVLHDDDRFFFAPDDLAWYLEDKNLKLEDVRLVIAEEDPKPEFELLDFLEDYLPEGGALDVGDTKRINGIVNRYIERYAPKVWIASDARPTLGSVRPWVFPSEEAPKIS